MQRILTVVKNLWLTLSYENIWNKVFKNGPSEICARQPLKNLKWYGLLKLFELSKDCLPQISHGPFLNTFIPYVT